MWALSIHARNTPCKNQIRKFNSRNSIHEHWVHILVSKKCALDSGKCVFGIVICGGWPCKTGHSSEPPVGGNYCADAVQISDERVAGKISSHVGTGYWIHWRRFCRAVTLTLQLSSLSSTAEQLFCSCEQLNLAPISALEEGTRALE